MLPTDGHVAHMMWVYRQWNGHEVYLVSYAPKWWSGGRVRYFGLGGTDGSLSVFCVKN